MARLVLLSKWEIGRWMMVLFTLALLIVLIRAGTIHISGRLSGAVSGKRVVIDPGHGGADPGASGRTGVPEKDIVLQVCLRLRNLLGRAGVYVQLTRDTDRDFDEAEFGPSLSRKQRDLGYRVDLANRAEADVFLSIHANSFPSARWWGAQVFYNPNRAFARELAGSIQSALVAKLGPNYRLAKPADYYVLNETLMPSAVVEIGFLSNPGEEAKLLTSEYQQRMAEAIYDGVLHYFLLRDEIDKRAVPAVIPLAEKR